MVNYILLRFTFGSPLAGFISGGSRAANLTGIWAGAVLSDIQFVQVLFIVKNKLCKL